MMTGIITTLFTLFCCIEIFEFNTMTAQPIKYSNYATSILRTKDHKPTILFVLNKKPNVFGHCSILDTMSRLIDNGYTVRIHIFKPFLGELNLPGYEKYNLHRLVTIGDELPNLENFDVIFPQSGHAGIMILPYLKSNIFKKKFIVRLRQKDIDEIQYKFNQYQELFLKSTYIITPCQFLVHKLIQYGCSEEKIKIIFSPINSTLFPFHTRKPQLNDPIKLITVCRLTSNSGLDFAIDAFAKVASLYSNVIYTIVGDGQELQRLRQKVIDYQLTERVNFLSKITELSQLALLFDQYHIFIYPSPYANEYNNGCISNDVKRAMNSGLIILSTYGMGISEFIVDGISGFLVPEGNIDFIAQKMLYLINNIHIWPRVTMQARKIAEQFDLNKTIRSLEALFLK